MPLETQASGTFQTTTGQPVGESNVNPALENNTSDAATISAGEQTDDGSVTEVSVDSTEVNSADKKPTPVDTEISPQALRQITALSSTVRALKKEIEHLKTQATPEDVKSKLARLEALENETPRDYLKRKNLDLEKVAADVLSAEESQIADPRVDGLAEVVTKLQAQLEAEKAAKATSAESEKKAAEARITQQATQLMQDIIKSQPERWASLQTDTAIAGEAVKAAIIVVERDFKKPDGSYKPITAEQRDAIFHDCLDEAETVALARKMVADRKNGGNGQQPVIPLRKELEVQDSDSYRQRAGDDGKGAGSRTPRVTIGSERGATRSQGQVKRGPTDVRTARARAMRVAGADVPDE